MPNLPTHLSLATRTAEKLGSPQITAHMGSFLLGSTSPDIRIMTKSKRDDTHFAPLDFQDVGSGIRGLFDAHPGLACSKNLSWPTKAFLAGYFTHLVADETWIVQIYRNFFHNGASFGDEVRANLWDRAAQLEMDRVARLEMGDFHDARTMLDGSEVDVDIGFISEETLGEWSEWVSKFTEWEFTWERLRFAAKRLYQDGEHATQIVEEFLEDVDNGLEQVYSVAPRERIDSFQDEAVRTASRFIREHILGT